MLIQLAANERTALQAQIKRATLAAHRAVEKLDLQTLGDLQGIYQQAAGDLATRIAAHAGADGNLTLQELQSALAQVNAILKDLSAKRDALLQGGLQAAADLGVTPYLAGNEEMVAVLSAAEGMRVSQEALQFVRNFVAADGLQLSDRVWRLDRHARDLVVNSIEQAVIQGHGASQAAFEFLSRGASVPADVAAKMGAANVAALSKGVANALMKDKGSPLDNAMRLFRTEINRAHGEAFMKGGEATPGFAGWRYLLSPAHPEPDICDLLSTQNLYGLGKGVYPTRDKTPWPAHPNTLSFIEMVFADEITEADKAGKNTSLEALQLLSAQRQRGVLGAGKFDLYKEGKLSQGMIRTPLSSVKARVTALENSKAKAAADAAAKAEAEAKVAAAAKAAAKAALEKAAEDAKQKAAKAQLEAIAGATKGFAFQALQKLKQAGAIAEDMAPAAALDKVNELAASLKLKKQTNDALSKYKAAALAGKPPPPAGAAIVDAMPAAEKEAFLAKIEEAKIAAAKKAAAEAEAAAKAAAAEAKAAAEKAAAEAAAAAEKAAADAAKAGQLRFADLEQIGPQGGSNAGGLYRQKATGEQWYVKTPASEDMARNEILANRLYKAAGIDVPEVVAIDVRGQPGVASKIIPGLANDRKALASGRVAGVYDGFAIDAWLANWDAVGLNFDNMLIKDGRAWRIDAGGALRYRAQGGLKGAQWGPEVTELDTLRNASTNKQTASVFSKMTQAQLQASAQKLKAMSDAEIKNIVRDFGPLDQRENAALVDTLIARKNDIIKRVLPNDVVVPLPRDAGTRVTLQEFEQIRSSRLNGYAMVTDKDQIEDQQVLVWFEKGKDGAGKTLGSFKLTEPAAKKFSSLLKIPDAGPMFYDSGLHDKILETVKGIASQATKGEEIREKDRERAAAAIALFAKASKGVKDAAEREAFVAHFKPWVDAIKDSISKPGPKASWKPPTEKLVPFEPPKKVPAPDAPFKFEKKTSAFERKRVERGVAVATGEANYSAGYFYEANISGTRLRYWPGASDVPYALRNTVEVAVSGDGVDDTRKLFSAIRAIGIDSERASALDREALYLRQIAYHRRTGYDAVIAAADAAGDQAAKVDAMKAALSSAIGRDITKAPLYNPEGTYQAFGQGRRFTFRPDLEGKDWDKFQRDYVLHHHITQGNLVDSIEKVLNTGGQFAPTTDKLRRGIPVGGMSPDADLESGGGSYFFTRLKSRTTAQKNAGVVWKSRLVGRLDAISYDGDRYGRTTGTNVIDHRKSGVEEWRMAARSSSNETIFKNSLSLFDDLEHIIVAPGEYDRLLAVFKKHGYTSWPDGRAITDVVKKIGSI